MKVSILLPFHNAAPWISETIQSIQAQTHADWELIAIDDFSTDDSHAILEQFAASDSRIQLLKNAVKGIIPALQLGWVFRSPRKKWYQFQNKRIHHVDYSMTARRRKETGVRPAGHIKRPISFLFSQ